MADRAIIERYVGLPYEPGVFDCVDLVARVQREVFGREVHLPQDRPRPQTLGDMAAAIGAHTAAIARRRRPEEKREGDGVLLARGCAKPTHVGVLVQLGERVPQWYVLHNATVRLSSVLTLLRDLPLAGWRIEGFYEWT